MSAVSVFAPARFGRLFASDAINVSRDPTLMFAILLSLAPALAFAFGRDPMDAAMQDAFGVEAFSRYVLPVVICLPAFLVSWVTGFLFLEDRDEMTLLALDITPVGKAGYMSYRVAVTVIVTLTIAAYTIWLSMPGVGMGMALLLAGLVSLEAIAAALILPAMARNKVEGLAVTKLTNIAAMAPLLAVIPSPLRYFGGVIPTFWIGELLGLSSEAYLPIPAVVALAIITHLAAVVLIYRLLQRRVG